MQNGAMKARLDSSYLSGSNQSWIEQLYEDFLTDPDSVDANWRSMFQQLHWYRGQTGSIPFKNT